MNKHIIYIYIYNINSIISKSKVFQFHVIFRKIFCFILEAKAIVDVSAKKLVELPPNIRQLPSGLLGVAWPCRVPITLGSGRVQLDVQGFIQFILTDPKSTQNIFCDLHSEYLMNI